jgi:hypothetical protein
MSSPIERRAFLRLTVAGLAGAAAGVPLGACGAGSPSPDPGSRRARPGDGRILLAYFSRPGENYWYGGRKNLRVGNTEVLARMISAQLDCDVHRIEAVDRYSADYDETVERNVREQDADARPAIADPLPSTGTTRSCWPADLERPGADDHDHFRRELRLLGRDRPPGHHARHERPGHDVRGLRAGVRRRAHRRRACGSGRRGRSAGPSVDAWLRR